MPAGLRNEKEEREVVAEKGENDFEVNIQSMNSDSHAPNDLSINDFLSFFIFFLVILFHVEFVVYSKTKWLIFLVNVGR